MNTLRTPEFLHDTRRRLLDTALHVIRARGYRATRVEDVCAAAGLSKGSFFHYFDSKEGLALEAATDFSETADRLFASAPYHVLTDPRARVLAYVDFRIALLQGALPDCTCLLGTMVQETYETHPAIRAACDRYIRSHAAMVAVDIAEARRRHAPHASWSADGLALHVQGVVQGAFVLAKAGGSPSIAADSLRHLRRYLELLFASPPVEAAGAPVPARSTRSASPSSSKRRRATS